MGIQKRNQGKGLCSVGVFYIRLVGNGDLAMRKFI